MVVSKRCKICTTMDDGNIPISGECFGKQIPELVATISGIELDPRKLNGVRVCQLCSIMMIHMEGFVKKLRKSTIRLQKSNKIQKTPKTASKGKSEVGSETRKKGLKKEPNILNGDVVFKKITDEKKTPTKIDGQVSVNETPLKNTKRKLAYQEEVSNKAAKPVNTKKETKHTPEGSDSILTYLQNNDSQEELIGETNENNDSQEELIGETNCHAEFESTTEEAYIHPKGEEAKKIKKVNCVICGKSFNQKRMLREHIEFIHMGEKLKECPNCFMEFRSVQKYESHVFNEKCKTTLYPCQFEKCNKRFKNSYKMEDHMKENHFSAMITEAD